MPLYGLNERDLARVGKAVRAYEDQTQRGHRPDNSIRLIPQESVAIELDDSIEPDGDNPQAYRLTFDSDGAVEDPDYANDSTFEVVDVSNSMRALGYQDTAAGEPGARGLCVEVGGHWVIVQMQEQAKLCTCKLTAAKTGSDASFLVDTIVPIDGGQNPVANSTSATVTAYNVRACAGADNADALIVWNETTDHWEVVAIINVTEEVVTAWRYDTSTHRFQVQTRTCWCNWAGAASEWTDVSTDYPVSQSVVTDVEDATTYLTHDKLAAYVLEKGLEDTDNVVALEECP